ncbi:MAG: hypothetical protein H6909_05190 [Rickettsiaceae bacterium]|nr:hypothetical protein [Rickettsiaceae bacterium]
MVDCFDKWIANHENDGAKACDIAIEKGDYCKSVGLYEDAKRAYHEVPCFTEDKTIIRNTFYKIANILEDQDYTRINFNQMADEENFYHFDIVNTDFIDSIAETSVKLLGHN